MSTSIPQSPPPRPPSRWTPEVVIGLLALLASLVLPYFAAPAGVATACGLFAAWLLGPLPSPLSPRGPGDQRGQVDVQALGAVAGVAFALLLLIVAALSTSGCGSTYQAERRAVVDWTPGPPCHLEVHLDEDPKPVVTVDAPTACEPPPMKCPATIPPESAAEPN